MSPPTANPFPLKARLDVGGTAPTYAASVDKITAVADQFFGAGNWKLLSMEVDTLATESAVGDTIATYFRFTAIVAGPTT